MARIDYITQTQVQDEYFSDFLSSFDKSPLSSDLARTKNENSVKQSVRNLILTNLGERVFQSTIGGNINRMLFEPMTGFTANDIEKDILNTLSFNEPRIGDVTVSVLAREDLNQFVVNVFFTLLNTNQPTSLSLILQRVR